MDELFDIYYKAVYAEGALIPAWNRAFSHRAERSGQQSRHFRRIERSAMHHAARWIAASRRMQEMERKMSPDYVF